MNLRRIQVVVFGPVRDIVGTSEITLELKEPFTGAAALETLAGLYPALAAWKGSVRLAVNRAYAPFDQTLQTGDEVSFLPPVSGG
jgi:molybdopterin converting factor subunit 1